MWPNLKIDGVKQISAPTSFDQPALDEWMSNMKAMRTACQQAVGYNGSAFEVPELLWTQTALGNGTNGVGYTVDKWLADLNARYGGIDKALVLLPYHPWDHSTQGQQSNNITDPIEMAKLLRDTGADGFNGDTMGHIPQTFYDASVELYKPIAMEPEGTPPAWDYNYATAGSAAPPVSKPKWITAGKRQSNFCERWQQVKIPALQTQWFNGDGYETWENVWGTWNGITERDSEAIRRVGTMLRFFGRRGFLHAWPLTTGETLWTMIRPTATSHNGAPLRFYDCYNGRHGGAAARPPPFPHHGRELRVEGGVLSFDVEAVGFACVLLGTMAAMTRKPLADLSPAWHYLEHGPDLNQTMMPINKTSPRRTGDFRFVGQGIEIEGGKRSGVDVQFPWEDYPQRQHSTNLSIGAMYVDRWPVTNAQYAEYHWEDGAPKPGWEQKPVTYVSLGDARAYCAFHDKRLPHVYEW
eukprot:gene23542-58540_t